MIFVCRETMTDPMDYVGVDDARAYMGGGDGYTDIVSNEPLEAIGSRAQKKPRMEAPPFPGPFHSTENTSSPLLTVAVPVPSLFNNLETRIRRMMLCFFYCIEKAWLPTVPENEAKMLKMPPTILNNFLRAANQRLWEKIKNVPPEMSTLTDEARRNAKLFPTTSRDLRKWCTLWGIFEHPINQERASKNNSDTQLNTITYNGHREYIPNFWGDIHVDDQVGVRIGYVDPKYLQSVGACLTSMPGIYADSYSLQMDRPCLQVTPFVLRGNYAPQIDAGTYPGSNYHDELPAHLTSLSYILTEDQWKNKLVPIVVKKGKMDNDGSKSERRIVYPRILPGAFVLLGTVKYVFGPIPTPELCLQAFTDVSSESHVMLGRSSHVVLDLCVSRKFNN